MKKLTLFLFLMLLMISTIAQERITLPKKVYKAEDGKLYINKALPIYLHLSTSAGNDAEKYLLESEDSKAYTNPFYFDTEGYNTVRTPSKVDTSTKKVVYPLQDIIFEIYTDSRPPKTSIKNKNKAFLSNEKLYFSGSFALDFRTYDATSGVEIIYYSIDGQPFTKFTDPIKLEQEKEYKVKFYSIDHVGNAEETNESTIVIDKTSPQTNVEINGERHENVVSGNSSIVLKPEESGSGVKNVFYKSNDNPYKIFKYPIKTSWFSEGDHVIKYYSEDHVGNKEDENTFSFYVDKTPPIIVEEIMGNTFVANGVEYSSGRSKFKITVMDNKAGVKSIHYQIQGQEEKIYTEPFYLSGNNGNLRIKTWAFDNVNNKATGGKSNQGKSASYIDLAGPELNFKFQGPFFQDRDTIFISTKTSVKLIASDSESGLDYIGYSVDGGKEVKYDKPFNVKNQGLHQVSFTGYDKVGNTNASNFSFVIDNSPPTINYDFSVEPIGSKTALDKTIKVYPDHMKLFLSATDDLAGLKQLYFKINDGKLYPYNTPIDIFKGGRDYKIYIKSIDKLSNQTEEEIEFSIN